jgi:hypothetical protein
MALFWPHAKTFSTGTTEEVPEEKHEGQEGTSEK